MLSGEMMTNKAKGNSIFRALVVVWALAGFGCIGDDPGIESIKVADGDYIVMSSSGEDDDPSEGFYPENGELPQLSEDDVSCAPSAGVQLHPQRELEEGLEDWPLEVNGDERSFELMFDATRSATARRSHVRWSRYYTGDNAYILVINSDDAESIDIDASWDVVGENNPPQYSGSASLVVEMAARIFTEDDGNCQEVTDDYEVFELAVDEDESAQIEEAGTNSLQIDAQRVTMILYPTIEMRATSNEVEVSGGDEEEQDPPDPEDNTASVSVNAGFKIDVDW